MVNNNNSQYWFSFLNQDLWKKERPKALNVINFTSKRVEQVVDNSIQLDFDLPDMTNVIKLDTSRKRVISEYDNSSSGEIVPLFMDRKLLWETRKSMSLFRSQVDNWDLYAALKTIIAINNVIKENPNLPEEYVSNLWVESYLSDTIFSYFETERWYLNNSENINLFSRKLYELISQDIRDIEEEELTLNEIRETFTILNLVSITIERGNDNLLYKLWLDLVAVRENKTILNMVIKYLEFRMRSDANYDVQESIKLLAYNIRKVAWKTNISDSEPWETFEQAINRTIFTDGGVEAFLNSRKQA